MTGPALHRCVQRLVWLSRALSALAGRAAMLFFWVMLTLILVQVFLRYFIGGSPSWIEEASRYCMIWGGLLGLTVAFRAGADPVVHPVPQDAPRWRWRVQAGMMLACVILFCLPVLVAAPEFVAGAAHHGSEALGLNMGLVVAIVPLMAGLVLFHALVMGVQTALGLHDETDDRE